MAIPSTGDPIAVYRLPDFDLVATPITSHGISYQAEESGPGSGQVSITLDDPAYAEIQVNDVIAIRRDGDTAEALLVELIHERTMSADGGAEQAVTYQGRLVGAMLEWALIAPALGDQAKPIEDDAVFDWRSPRYDPADDPWDDSNEIMTVTAAKAGAWPTQPMGEDFSDETGAYMIWDASGDDDSAPAGTCLFYEDVTISTPGRHGLELLMDNDGYVFVDGIQVLEVNQFDGYHRVSFKRLELTNGTHRFAFQTRNIDGPAALAYNLFKTDQQDHPMPGVGVVAMSSASTQVLSYPDPFPGMTVGKILEDLIAEAQARGALEWCVTSFSNTVDSDGETWDREVGITTKTGTTTLLQFLDELVAGGRVGQWRWRNDGITLDVFAPGYSNRPGDVYLEPAPVDDPRTGQVLQLDRKIT